MLRVTALNKNIDRNKTAKIAPIIYEGEALLQYIIKEKAYFYIIKKIEILSLQKRV